MEPVVSRHHGLLGTVIELRVWAEAAPTAIEVEAVAIDEIERLQRVFDVHDPESGLRRWLDDQTALARPRAPSPSPELRAVVALAAEWRARSRGAFDPAVGSLVDLWRAAEGLGRPPSAEALAAAVTGMHDPDDPRSRPSNLNALAKGWIVDRSVERALTIPGAVGITVNAGGDLRHRAPEPLVVGIEDPARPYDNVAPLMRVRLGDGALATSGGARRGWHIGGARYSHVIDPRTGHPVDHVASASVLAPDAATADVVATVLTVLPVEEGLAFAGDVADVADVAACIVTADGAVHRDARWAVHELVP